MLNHKLNYSHIITTFITAFIIFICINPLIDVAFHILLFDAVVSGILLTGLLMLLAYITKYGYFSSSIFRQQIINYFTLAVLFVALWPGLEYLILYISFPDEYLLFLPSLTIRIIISLLVFGLFMALFSRFNISENLKESETISVEIEKVEEPKEIIERIAVKSGQKIEVIPVDDVIHLQAEGDYVMIHSTKGKFLKEQTMKSFECTLPREKFVRVHRSYIINVDYIAQIELYNKQSQILKLKNGNQVRISLSGYKALKETLGL